MGICVYWVLRGLSGLIAGLSEGAVDRLSAGLGWLWWNVVRFRRATMTENLHRAFPSASVVERTDLGRKTTRHLSRTFLETLRIRAYARTHFVNVDVRGMEHVEEALGQGRGALILSGHLGSFELAMAAARDRAPAPMSVVVKRFSPGADRFVTEVRTGAGLRVIDASRAVEPVRAALRRNEIVIFVLDQNATRSIGVFVDFFGKPACTMRVLAALALRSGAPVLAAIARREPSGAHRLEISRPLPSDFGMSRRDTVQRRTQAYTSILERAIREEPAQWFWAHRRWKTRPRGS